jgi:hypothetical protein
MAIEKAFKIAVPNEPYVNDFSDGTEQDAVYNGEKFLKFQYNATTGVIVNVIGGGDTEEEMVANEGPVMEGHLPGVINADTAPLHAAMINRTYDSGAKANYTEDLGTTDAEGAAETWEHTWNDNMGLLSQIWQLDTIKYVDNAIVTPEFRTHGTSEAQFTDSITSQVAACTTELARADVYTDDETTAITAHKTFLEGIATKYAGVSFWKIPFPTQPNFK